MDQGSPEEFALEPGNDVRHDDDESRMDFLLVVEGGEVNAVVRDEGVFPRSARQAVPGHSSRLPPGPWTCGRASPAGKCLGIDGRQFYCFAIQRRIALEDFLNRRPLSQQVCDGGNRNARSVRNSSTVCRFRSAAMITLESRINPRRGDSMAGCAL